MFCVKTYYETKTFKIVQARYRRKLNFNTFPNKSQIFKLVKNFEVHGTYEDHSAISSSPSGPPISQEEYARVINNFTRRIQQRLQLNGGHLEHVLSGSSGHFGSCLRLYGCSSQNVIALPFKDVIFITLLFMVLHLYSNILLKKL